MIKCRFLFVIVMVALPIVAIYAQKVDYLGKAREFLAQGDCERAAYAYEDYKIKVEPLGNAEVEKLIAECKKKEAEHGGTKDKAVEIKAVQTATTVYVDLGLPSGTKWKAENEEGGFYTYDEAVGKFGDKLPTRKQQEELKNKCQWLWTGSGYKVTGPNGKSIVLPAAGYRGCSGSVHYVGSYGSYWSSTPSGSEYAWILDFYSGGVYMGYDSRCYGRSVRLVQD